MLSGTLRVDHPEGKVAGPLKAVAEAHPGVSIGSYPFSEEGRHGTNLVARTEDAGALDAAMADLRAMTARLGEA